MKTLFMVSGTAVLAAAALLAAGPAEAVSLQPDVPASDFDLFAAGATGNRLPSALAAGDWNGDGMDDTLACSWQNNSCAIYLGRPQPAGVVYRPDIVLVGPSGRFGGAANFIGDVNGDGFDDVAVGSPTLTAFDTAIEAGALWVFFGRAYTAGGAVGYYLANVSVLSTTTRAQFGSTAAPAGDVNGDGVDDFWVSAPNEPGGGSRWGVLYLFHGNRSMPTYVTDTSAARRIVGITPTTSGPHTLLGGRDIDGDGAVDLVVASPDYVNGSGFPTGAAVIFFGPLSSTPAVLSMDDADVTLWGAATVTSFGRAVAFSPNFAVGSIRTLAIGADRAESALGQGGAIYLFDTSGLRCCADRYPWDADGLVYSAGGGDKLGASLAFTDLDGDGRDDLAAGAPDTKISGGQRSGRTYLFYGGTVGGAPVLSTDADAWVNGPRQSAAFGELLVALDYDNDGRGDFVAGAPGDAVGGSSSGSIYGFLGRPRNRAPSISLAAPATALEGQAINVTLEATDPDDDRLSIIWDLGGGEPLEATTGKRVVNLSFPNQGTFAVTVFVSDGDFLHTDTTVVEVANVPPTCALWAPTAFVEGRAGSVRANITDPGQELVDVVWSGPPGMERNGTVFNYRPEHGAAFTLQLWLTDDVGATGTCSAEVPVINLPPTAYIDGPTEFYEGDDPVFVASAEDAGPGDNFTFYWATPTGTVEGAVLTWSPTRVGYVDLYLRVVDLDGGEGNAVAIVHVLSRAPVVTLSIPAGLQEGDRAQIQVVQHSGAEYDRLNFTWSVCSFPRTAPRTGGYVIDRAPPGKCPVRVTVTDDDGDSVELAGTLEVANRPPALNITASADAPYTENQRVDFRVQLAPWETAEADLQNYTWRLDGLVVGTGPVLRAALPGGSHELSVTVVDPTGGRSTLSTTFAARNNPPSVFIEGPTRIHPGEVGSWVAVGTDPPDNALTFVWEVDGVRGGQGENLTWSSASPGLHTVRVTASDGAGGFDSFELTVEVAGAGGSSFGTDAPAVVLWVALGAGVAAGVLFGGKARDRIRGRRDGQ